MLLITFFCKFFSSADEEVRNKGLQFLFFCFFSSGTFLSAKQDKTGTLAWVEEKMARATMVPVSHGEVFTYQLNFLHICIRFLRNILNMVLVSYIILGIQRAAL